MDTTPLRSPLDHHGPFGSGYVDVTVTVPDGRDRIDTLWHDVRRTPARRDVGDAALAALEPAGDREPYSPGEEGVSGGDR